ncbi:hypothetical protein [Francisella sp. SYW-9]|uniref:hypothetical protein n=1 Tax=Francisella sp. SYW-9 TaxID=2610888 RepID=UPI00123D103D|nr:hypothetical protein [Francisella sp. SYW-9]
MKKGQVKIQGMDIFDASVTYPYPSWFSSGLIGHAKNNQHGPIFTTTEIPTGQTFESWTEKYSINAIYSYGKYKKNINLDKFTIYSIAKLMRNCRKENMNAKALPGSKNNLIMIIYCGRTISNPKIGEIGVFRFTKYKNTYFKIAQQWKVKSFNSKEVTNISLKQLGVNPKNFNNAKKMLNEVSFSPSLRPMK